MNDKAPCNTQEIQQTQIFHFSFDKNILKPEDGNKILPKRCNDNGLSRQSTQG